MALHAYGPNGQKDEITALPDPEPEPTVLRVTGLDLDRKVTNVYLYCWPDGTVSWKPVKTP